MKIVLISGMSGAGKTSIAQNLCERHPEKYNFVQSYTDRKQRKKDEWGHTFVSSIEMDVILSDPDIVAQTQIEKNRYCALKEQFDDNKINLYVVDTNGINDTMKTFSDAYFMTVLIRKRDVEVECIRLNRDVNIPVRDDVDFLIDNNGTIESSANLLNALINFDFFSQYPSHVMSLKEKIEYIDMQYRFLDDTKESLYEQLWYIRLPAYRKLCAYVEKKINEEFDYDGEIKINPDTAPEIFNGCLNYNVQAEYDSGDLMWDEINRLVERVSYHAHTFCKKNGYDDIAYRMAVSERWSGEDDYE